jgi:hypothetical protein
MNYLKRPQHRSASWRRAVASLPCAMCGREGPSQAAHPNHIGKGMAMKSHDCWTTPMCHTCHSDFDQGTTYTREEKRELMDRMIIETIYELAVAGLVKAKT